VVWSRENGVDAADPQSVQQATARMLETHGAPWGLVHTVGDFFEAPLLSTPPSQFHEMVQSNLVTALHVIQAVAPSMLAQKRGRIVLFAAAGAGLDRAMLRAPIYFAIKAALVHMARSLAAECAKSGVTVNVVSPGLIGHPHSHQESQQRMLQRVPVGRLGNVDDVVSLVQWLLSEQSSYMTGQDLTVDGGLQL
jgi:3-oxoacyl-[acyl-carrier protein] reductase